jgi:hypothetical protein
MAARRRSPAISEKTFEVVRATRGQILIGPTFTSGPPPYRSKQAARARRMAVDVAKSAAADGWSAQVIEHTYFARGGPDATSEVAWRTPDAPRTPLRTVGSPFSRFPNLLG